MKFKKKIYYSFKVLLLAAISFVILAGNIFVPVQTQTTIHNDDQTERFSGFDQCLIEINSSERTLSQKNNFRSALKLNSESIFSQLSFFTSRYILVIKDNNDLQLISCSFTTNHSLRSPPPTT